MDIFLIQESSPLLCYFLILKDSFKKTCSDTNFGLQFVVKDSFLTHFHLSEHLFGNFSYYLLYIELNLLEESDVTPDRQHVDVSSSKTRKVL